MGDLILASYDRHVARLFLAAGIRLRIIHRKDAKGAKKAIVDLEKLCALYVFAVRNISLESFAALR